MAGGEDTNSSAGSADREQSPPVAFALPEGFRSHETEELVRLAQSGEAEALNELFLRYHGIMLEVARRKLGAKLRRKEDPDDLAQTTFREATRDFKSYQYRGEDSLLRWLIQILQNKIRDKAEFYSAGKRDTAVETALEGPVDSTRDTPSRIEPPSHDLSVTRQVQRDESFQLLRKAVEELSPEHRQAITLVFFQGMQLRDAGERMGGKTEDAVRMMLRRAEGRLNELLRTKLGKDPES
ncbi:MAG: RNA polymerase sigma factor [Planctomycetes bacterium]|nr:RNA polymerase sigma factor [Planctomycetota bacterium]